MKPVHVLEEAARDLEQARIFYDSIAPNLGDRFVEAILEDLERLGKIHGVHGTHTGFHRMLARRFPYAIYYLETSREVQVFAVLDLRRDPVWMADSLAKRP